MAQIFHVRRVPVLYQGPSGQLPGSSRGGYDPWVSSVDVLVGRRSFRSR